jgi:TonB family protein
MRARVVWLSIILGSTYGCASARRPTDSVEIPIPPPVVATHLLIEGLASPDPGVRAQSAWQLAGATELRAEARKALDPLRADGEKSVRYATAWALGHLEAGSEESESDQGNTIPPKPIRITRPAYPQAAFDAKVQGVVLVELLIGEQGEVVHAEIRRSIPPLDAAALACVRQWLFQPQSVAGSSRATLAHAPVAFRIFGGE